MRDRRCPSRNKGFVLVVVICMIMAMTGLVLAFNRRARAGVQTADALRKSVQALCCARSGLAMAEALIRSGVASLEYKTSINLGDGSCRMELSDEQGKLNLNRLADPNGRLERTRIDQVLRLIDLTHRDDAGEPMGYGIVPAIIDWIDSDDRTTCLDFVERQNTGAESDYYLGLEPPYRCANRPLEAPEELLLVKGLTSQVYRRLAPYVTVYGDGLVNINTAPKRVIESLCERMDPALTQVIVERRRVRPFRSLEELRQVPGMTGVVFDRIQPLITMESTGLYYRLQATGQVDNLSRTVSAILRKNTGHGTVDIVSYREDRTQETEVRSQDTVSRN
jgi:general secretion pathway protein K